MTTDWHGIICKVALSPQAWIVHGFAASMPDCIARAELTTPLRQAHFLAQTVFESANLRTTVEYASGQEYEGRRDLGNTHPGDGERFKGRGLIQITGRANYATFGEKLGIDIVAEPEKAAMFPYAALLAAEYWKARNINRHADANDINGVTRAVNGGLNGLSDRIIYLHRAQRALAPAAPHVA